jgi:hypothetical protein
LEEEAGYGDATAWRRGRGGEIWSASTNMETRMRPWRRRRSGRRRRRTRVRWKLPLSLSLSAVSDDAGASPPRRRRFT